MENEFDNVQDDIADIDVDWEQILPVASATNAQLGNARQPSRASSLDFSDEAYDPDTLEEIAMIERHALTQNLAVNLNANVESGSTSNASTSRYFPNSGPNLEGPSCAKLVKIETPKKKRKLYPVGSVSPSNKRSRTTSSSPAIEGFEDELTCPICCDVFVAVCAANPCGHSFCGPCGEEWTRKNQNDRCPICRTQLAWDKPLIPNISVDSVVERYITLLAQSGSVEWSVDGDKFKDWYSRKVAWKMNNQTRPKPAAVNVVVYSEADDFTHLDVRDFEVGSPVRSHRRSRRHRLRRYRGTF